MLIQEQGATPNIPPKSNRRWKPCFSKRLYRERNLIERFFSKLKHFRRVATHYDKLAANFLAMIQLASMRLWLRAYRSTTLDRLDNGWPKIVGHQGTIPSLRIMMSSAAVSSRGDLVFLIRAARDDFQRLVRPRPLQRLGFVPPYNGCPARR